MRQVSVGRRPIERTAADTIYVTSLTMRCSLLLMCAALAFPADYDYSWCCAYIGPASCWTPDMSAEYDYDYLNATRSESAEAAEVNSTDDMILQTCCTGLTPASFAALCLHESVTLDDSPWQPYLG
jgi:hypothetical protein